MKISGCQWIKVNKTIFIICLQNYLFFGLVNQFSSKCKNKTSQLLLKEILRVSLSRGILRIIVKWILEAIKTTRFTKNHSSKITKHMPVWIVGTVNPIEQDNLNCEFRGLG